MTDYKDSDDLVRIPVAAKILGVSEGHARRLYLQGEIPGYKPFGKKGALFFDPTELRQYVRLSRIPTKKEISERASEILNANTRKRRAKVSA